MRVHDAAFIAMLKADSVLADSTFEGVVTARPSRYVTVYTRDTRTVSRFQGPQAEVECEYIVHSIGTTTEQAKLVRERVFAQVLDKTPAVTGWNSRRVRHITSQPMGLDKDPSPPMFYAVDVFAFSSEPLPV